MIGEMIAFTLGATGYLMTHSLTVLAIISAGIIMVWVYKTYLADRSRGIRP